MRRGWSGVIRPWVGVVAIAACGVSACSRQSSSTEPPTTTSAPVASSSTATGPPVPAQVVLDLSSDTSTEAPIAGLVAIALSPDGRSLVTMRNTRSESIEVRVQDYEPDGQLLATQGRVLLDVPHPYVHSGGGLAFDRDGNLLVGLGALPQPDEPPGPRNPDGSIVRVPRDVLEARSGEPWQPARSDIPVRGLRQPWRMSVDTGSGDLWIGDVGENTAEELDRITPEQLAGGGVELGWPFREGAEPGPVSGDPPADSVEPVWSRNRLGQPGANVVGGVVYRGSRLADLAGKFVFSDFTSRELTALDVSVEPPVVSTLGIVDEHPTAFVQGPDGDLWMLSVEGGVFRLVAGATPGSITTEVVARTSTTTSPRPGEESTALAIEPDGRAVLVSDRGGRIRRIALDPMPPAVCALATIRLLPQLAYDPPERQADEVGRREAIVSAAVGQVPSYLADDIDRLRTFQAELIRRSRTSGWADPSLQALVREASVERGDFAATLRSENALANFANNRCPAAPPATPGEPTSRPTE